MKSTKKQLIESIMNELNKGSGITVTDLADEIGSNWKTINDFVEILSDLNVVRIEDTGKKKIVFLQETNVELGKHDYNSQGTFFNIPIPKESYDRAKLLFFYVNKALKKKHKGEFKKTASQKVAYEVITRLRSTKFDLHIPIGWYLYGGITILADIDDVIKPRNIFSSDFEKKIEEEVNYVTNKVFKDTEYSNGYIYSQYTRTNNRLYLAKSKLLKNLKDNKSSWNDIKLLLLEIYSHIPNNEKILELKKKYYEKILEKSVYNENINEENFSKLKDSIEDLFNAFWQIFALYNFEKTLLEDGSLLMNQSGINYYFKSDISLSEETFEKILDDFEQNLKNL